MHCPSLGRADQGVDVDIGASLFLIGLGAIFAFAVNIDLPGIEIQVIGWILMIIGLFGMAVSFLYWRPRQRARRTGVVQERIYADDPSQPPPPV
jgi:hypothetical protein